MNLEVVARSTDRPLPRRDAFSGPYWDATQRHQLVLQRCDDCGTFRFYPRPMCPRCHSTNTTWTRCSGEGTVYSFTVVRRPLARWFAERMPIVCAVVQLAEGPRLVTDLVGVEAAQVRIGLAVRVGFEDVDDEITLPFFEPADRAAAPAAELTGAEVPFGPLVLSNSRMAVAHSLLWSTSPLHATASSTEPDRGPLATGPWVAAVVAGLFARSSGPALLRRHGLELGALVDAEITYLAPVYGGDEISGRTTVVAVHQDADSEGGGRIELRDECRAPDGTALLTSTRTYTTTRTA